MDKAYVDFEALFEIEQKGAFFVTRAKQTMHFDITETNYSIDERTGLISDQVIILRGVKSSKLYPIPLRMVVYWDSEKDITLEFITNNFEISALDVAYLYKYRWQIEVFFKWIKQSLTIKRLWGHSENAVHIHIWLALSTYLIVAYILRMGYYSCLCLRYFIKVTTKMRIKKNASIYLIGSDIIAISLKSSIENM